jgi:hypothetical protein
VQRVAFAVVPDSFFALGKFVANQRFTTIPIIGLQAAILSLPAGRAKPGCLLTLIADANFPIKPKHSLLPLLTVVFLISYGLLTFLVVEQDRVIGAQRLLIRQMLSDSNELSALKGKMVQQQNQAHPKSQWQSPAPPALGKKHSKNSHDTRRMPKLMPEKPPIPASDAMDERRALITI